MSHVLLITIGSLIIAFGLFGFAAISMFRGVTSKDPSMFMRNIRKAILICSCGLMIIMGLILWLLGGQKPGK